MNLLGFFLVSLLQLLIAVTAAILVASRASYVAQYRVAIEALEGCLSALEQRVQAALSSDPDEFPWGQLENRASQMLFHTGISGILKSDPDIVEKAKSLFLFLNDFSLSCVAGSASATMLDDFRDHSEKCNELIHELRVREVKCRSLPGLLRTLIEHNDPSWLSAILTVGYCVVLGLVALYSSLS